jgi:hypothetical protein
LGTSNLRAKSAKKAELGVVDVIPALDVHVLHAIGLADPHRSQCLRTTEREDVGADAGGVVAVAVAADEEEQEDDDDKDGKAAASDTLPTPSIGLWLWLLLEAIEGKIGGEPPSAQSDSLSLSVSLFLLPLAFAGGVAAVGSESVKPSPSLLCYLRLTSPIPSPFISLVIVYCPFFLLSLLLTLSLILPLVAPSRRRPRPRLGHR